jgi:hypothetical protein
VQKSRMVEPAPHCLPFITKPDRTTGDGARL